MYHDAQIVQNTLRPKIKVFKISGYGGPRQNFTCCSGNLIRYLIASTGQRYPLIEIG